MNYGEPCAADLDAVAGSLNGRRIERIAYYGLVSDSAEEWDFGTWHWPIMGVELVTDDGASYSAVWDSSLGNFSLHLSASPMWQHLLSPEEGGTCRRWLVQDHARWAALRAGPIVDSRLIWHPDLTDSGATAPAALRLTFAAGDAWIIAAMEQPGGWWLGADEVVVAFTSDMATRIGLPANGAD
ncbi:hypothetical protein AB0J80_24260 [Actinoplanes sp. NPDC049548]|uniref:hypothetical protein n=1 Tax=Actinoplanes sp. NPDC049548 TaxID=3155152 RepID=UPI00341CE6F4